MRKRTGYTAIPNAVIDMDPPLSPAAFRIYVYLCKIADVSNPEFPSHETFMAKCNISKSNIVKRGINELITRGLLHIENSETEGKTTHILDAPHLTNEEV